VAYRLALVGGHDLGLAANGIVDGDLDERSLQGHDAIRIGLERLEERGKPDAACCTYKVVDGVVGGSST
jgi:hypothetical protein